MSEHKAITASEMGRKGGRARWRGMTKAQRREHMRAAILVRWARKGPLAPDPEQQAEQQVAQSA